MPYSWVSERLDLTRMVMVIQKHLKTIVFIIPNNFCYNKITKSHSLGHYLVNALQLAVRGAGPHPDGHGHPEKIQTNVFIIYYYSCLAGDDTRLV